jgi:capsular exopolysaccharide synthesis family protein
VDLRQFLGTLRARWKFTLSTIVLGTLATVLLVLSISPSYGSSVKLFVSTPTNGQTDFAASLILGQRVASYSDLASDPSVIQRVVTRLNLDMTYEELQGDITAQVITGTQTIQLDVKASSPELAQQIADAESQELVELIKKLEKPADTDIAPAVIARVAGKPSFSSVAVSPNVPLDIAVGILLSIFVGIAGALLRDLLDRTVKSRDDVEEVSGSAILATLPYEPQVKKQPLTTDGGGTLAEALRVLRTNLEFANVDAKPQTILVSSAVPNEGKTLVATNLAISMAQAGRSVLLIDADMRNPNVADLLGLENSVGLVTVLVGRTTLGEATQSHTTGVSFLGTGPKPPNPAEVLNTQAMRDLLAQVRAEFDAVVIDAPPMLPVADASILSTEVDGVVLLVRYGSTTREQLRLAVSRIETVGGRLFGTILNRTPRRSGESYAYGYGYGYGSTEPAAPAKTSGQSGRPRRRALR